MLVTTLRTLVHAQADTVWGLLLDRMENPQHFLPTVVETRVLERFPDGMVRELRLPGGKVRERLTADKGEMTILSELLDHPLYAGTTVTRLVPTAVQNPMAPLHLEVDLRLERKSFHLEGMVKAEEEMLAAIGGEMELIKRKAEESEKGGA